MIRILLFIIAFTSCSASAQQIVIGAEPEWVEPLTIPIPTAETLAKSSGGAAFLISDNHTRWEGDTSFEYYRLTGKVMDRAGLEILADISQIFDPSSQALVLTRLDLWRGDQLTDLKPIVKPEIFRREQQLDAGIIDGSLTAHITVPDVRVGDIVDYSFVLRSTSHVPGGTMGGVRRLEFSEPTTITRVVIDWPRGKPFFSLPLPERVKFSSRYIENTFRQTWVRNNNISAADEEGTPVGYGDNAVLTFSGFADWSVFAGELAPYYEKDYPLTPAWDGKLAEIKEAYPDKAGQAVAALRLVQDEIRYVGLLVGAGGYYASAPETVITRGFGDCKDKALLLRVLLRKLGIDAVTALASIQNGQSLQTDLPRLGAFDHMIVRAKVDGRVYWMDGTGIYQRGTLINSVTPAFGFALPLTGPDQKKVEEIRVGPESRWDASVEERYKFTPLGVFLGVLSTYRGAAADSRRYEFATRPHSDLSDDYLTFYLSRYPGIQAVRPIKTTDNADENEFKTDEYYVIPAPALLQNELRENFPLGAENFASNLPRVQVGQRRTALDIGRRRINRHQVIVEGAPVTFTPPDSIRLRNPGFVYNVNGNAWGEGTLRMNWNYETRADIVAPEDFDSVIKDAREVADTAVFYWNLGDEKKTGD